MVWASVSLMASGRGNVQRGPHLHIAGEQKLPGFARQLEKVLDSGAVHIDVEVDVVAWGLLYAAADWPGEAEDGAAGGEAGVAEGGVNGVEDCVAVGTVHLGLEAGFERHGLAEVGQAEVAGGGRALHGKVAKGPLEAAG